MLANFIVDNHHPFTLVEEASFRAFVTSLNPSFDHVSADTIRRDILGMFTDNVIVIKSKLNDVPGHINFAQDLWTASNNDAYISITAHWMDGDWNLVETVLDLKEVRGPHSGENIAERFCESLEEFNLIPKVVLPFHINTFILLSKMQGNYITYINY